MTKRRKYRYPKITGRWLSPVLLAAIQPINGGKLLVVYGKADIRTRRDLGRHGFTWNKIAQRWERRTGKTCRIPKFFFNNGGMNDE